MTKSTESTVEIHAITDDEEIVDFETTVVDGYLNLPPRKFIEQGAGADPCWLQLIHILQDRRQGSARIDDPIDDEHVATGDRKGKGPRQLDSPCRLGTAIGSGIDEVVKDLMRHGLRQTTQQLHHERYRAIQNADHYGRSTGEVIRYLGGELLDTAADISGLDQDSKGQRLLPGLGG